MKRHIVLIGLPGAGKSTVGKEVAGSLQAAFVDIDAVITRKEGRPISIIFAEQGEAAFRTMEKREVEAALGTDPSVIVPGGGWAAQPGALESVAGRATLLYLKTKPETAAERTAQEQERGPGNRATFIGIGDDAAGRMRELLKEREAFYLKADAQVETDKRTPAQVAGEVLRLARSLAGW